MNLFLPHGFVISIGACADTKILISSDFTSAEYIYSSEVLKKIYYVQHVYLIVSSQILEN